MRKSIRIFIISIIVTLLVSCSSGLDNPIGGGIENSRSRSAGGAQIFGLWDVAIDPASGSIEATPSRSAGGVLNLVGLLEPPAYGNLTIDFNSLVVKPGQLYAEVVVLLTNPMQVTRFTGFDIRGVVYGPSVDNADGGTLWMNPQDFSGIPYGFQDGLMGTPGYQAAFGEYKYFANGLTPDMDLGDYFMSDPNALDNRGAFSPGQTIGRRYELYWYDIAEFGKFQYAVVGSYAFPAGTPPFAISDFPPEANMPEPLGALPVLFENNTYYDHVAGQGGGSFTLGVMLFDWYGAENNQVMIYSEGLFPPVEPTSVIPSAGGFPMMATYLFENVPATPLTSGLHNFSIVTLAQETYGESYIFGLMPPGNPLYNTKIMLPMDTTIYVPPAIASMYAIQTGNWYYDPVEGPSGKAIFGLDVNWPGNPVSTVMLDTTLFTGSKTWINEPSNEGGWWTFVENTSSLAPGPYDLPYTIYFTSGSTIGGVIPLTILDAAQQPPPFFSGPVNYNSTVIGSIEVEAFEEATTGGANIVKDFIPNGEATDCDEYRWIQVVSTDAPINGNAGPVYVDPNPNDDPPGAEKPFYWTDAEADRMNNAGAGEPRNPRFGDAPRRSAQNIPPNQDPTWWHAELCLVCVRNDQPDVLLRSEHYYFFVNSDGSVTSGHYDGVDGGSEIFRGVLATDFPGYAFQ